ncbi:MAG TPA: sugar phosphate isomerase/epimerase family protein [Actinocrinis sp.]|nr:sugar phosphate isomerase/epimerase family protein [Actinocrinis sp.]
MTTAANPNAAADTAADALSRLSLNQKTTNSWNLLEAVAGCLRADIPAIGVWREPLHEFGVDKASTLIKDAGLRVSSLCRGGFLTAVDPADRRKALDDNRAAIDEAAALGTDTLVMVVGGLPEGSRDLAGARTRVAEAVAQLAPHAGECGVRLALEPMHPIFAADRGVLSTLGQALDLAEQFPPEQVAVVVDTFHVWWDPQVEQQIARAAGRIAAFQVCDWITPLPADTLLSRGMMGDGHIDFAHLRRAVEAAGYTGDIEVEIFNADVWATDPIHVLRQMKDRYLVHVWGIR